MTQLKSVGSLISLVLTLLPFGLAVADEQADELVKLFHAYCVETDSNPLQIDSLVRLEKWEKQPQDMVTVGQASSAQDARGYMTRRQGQLYMLNYSRGAGCGILTQGPSGPEVLVSVKAAYRVSDTIDSEEGFQRTVMMVLSRDSLYEGSIISVAYLPSETNSVVALAHIPKSLADTVR